jgi:hypothetical protein
VESPLIGRDLLILASCFALWSAWGQSVPSGSISGRVTDASTGAGLHRAEVRIHVDDDNNTWGSAPTDSAGRYTLRALPPGKYRIDVSKPRYQGVSYGASRAGSSGQVIVLAAGETKSGVDFALSRYGVITGTVYGLDGEPMPQANVNALAWRQARGKRAWTPAGWAQTDDHGHFRLAGLAEGEYLIDCMAMGARFGNVNPGDGQPPLTYAATYAPGTAQRDEARRLRVTAGEETADADIRLLAVTPATLTVRATAPVALPEAEPAGGSGGVAPDGPAEVRRPPRAARNAPLVQCHIMSLVDRQAGATNWGGGFPLGQQWQFPNAEPGRYEIYASLTVGAQLYAARETRDVDGETELTLDLKPAIELQGRLKLEGGGKVSGGQIHLSPGDGFFVGEAPHADVHADGTFVLKNVPPGVWDISVQPMPKGAYYQAMWLGAAGAQRMDVLRKEMTITAESVGPLEIVLGDAAAEVTGRVEGGLARSVLAVPGGENAGIEAFTGTAEVDDQGNFHLRGLRPGVYSLYAFEDLPAGAWLEPGFLAAVAEYSVTLELGESARENVTLTPIPARRVAALAH